MVSLFTSVEPTKVVDASRIEVSAPEAAPETAAEAPEFEIVLGKRQISSLLFLATVIVVVFAAGAYLIGRSVTPREVSAAAPPKPAEAAPVLTVKPTAAPLAEIRTEAAIFAEPITGKTYIQMAAVEKGMAVIFAEGLRRRGLDGFVAPGPSEKLFRVLIGPFASEADYKNAKTTVDQIGLNTFPRRYQQQ